MGGAADASRATGAAQRSAIATAIAPELAKRSARRLIEEVEVLRVDRDGTSSPSFSWTCGGNDATRLGREPTTVSPRRRSQDLLLLGGLALICRASTLKYAIDSPPSDSTISTRGVDLRQVVASLGGVEVAGAQADDHRPPAVLAEARVAAERLVAIGSMFPPSSTDTPPLTPAVASSRFIGGVPMKPATNRFSGRS